MTGAPDPQTGETHNADLEEAKRRAAAAKEPTLAEKTEAVTKASQKVGSKSSLEKVADSGTATADKPALDADLDLDFGLGD